MNPDEIYRRLVDTGEDWADKNAAADLLEESKKAVLAEMVVVLLPNCKSVTEADTRALGSKQYREYLTAMVAARRAANRARVTYDSAKTLAELRRTEAATRRAEMQLV